jgi:hypothetical protein
MRILRHLVNPQWGAANRTARLRLAFFFRRRRPVCTLAHLTNELHRGKRASEASGCLTLRRLRPPICCEYNVTECKAQLTYLTDAAIIII